MTTPINDGGPAFPNKDELGNMVPGMTLRDYFAGQALAGVSSIPAFHTNIIEAQIKKPGREKATVGECVAFYCYDMADAMLATRSQQPEKP